MFDGAFANRRILVTGHTGFKGAWLCHWLERMGAQVTGLALEPSTTPDLFSAIRLEDRVEHHICDIRDADSVEKIVQGCRPEMVFHLAAQPLVRESYQTPRETFDVNVGGTVALLDALRHSDETRVCLVITTDKCYENREWLWGYRESDALGGHDPYSASKAAAEIAAASFRKSFFHSPDAMRLATVRAGNVIGGGDWSADRIVVDFIKSIQAGQTLQLRNPNATRPWQHVLEPLSGYLTLASMMWQSGGEDFAEAWNFGPPAESAWTVEQLAREFVRVWGSGSISCPQLVGQPHEARFLKLDCSKAAARLHWSGVWNVRRTVEETVAWYRDFIADADMVEVTDRQVRAYTDDAVRQGMAWAGDESAPAVIRRAA